MDLTAEYGDHGMGILAMVVDRLKGSTATAAYVDAGKEKRSCTLVATLVASRGCVSAAAAATAASQSARYNPKVPQQPVDDETDLKDLSLSSLDLAHDNAALYENFTSNVSTMAAGPGPPFVSGPVQLEPDLQVAEGDRPVVSVQAADASEPVDDVSKLAALAADSPLLQECMDGYDDSRPPVQVPSGTSFVSTLGEGQFGSVSLVKRNTDGLQIASKRMHRSCFNVAEYELLAMCCHENIVSVVGWTAIGEWAFLQLEYQQGVTLNVWKAEISGSAPVTEDKLDLLGFDLLSALQHLEQRRILHRDIKPSNIIVTWR